MLVFVTRVKNEIINFPKATILCIMRHDDISLLKLSSNPIPFHSFLNWFNSSFRNVILVGLLEEIG